MIELELKNYSNEIENIVGTISSLLLSEFVRTAHSITIVFLSSPRMKNRETSGIND